ncbi:MAG: glycosyltransferase family 39 protein [Prevotellaceae bacterium]|jgi:4-amino-4-deoxy-L-arabinose transferase-like glycosyltransferase|nr:glycosyltransferase family 39 protein [Prevotellaceae bacterium]
MNTVNIKKYIPHVIFFAVAAFFALSLYHRTPNGDEAIIAEHSYWFDKLGYVCSNFFSGYLDGEDGWDSRQYFYHKLFVLTGVGFMKIFGFHIYSFRLISLLFALIFFVFLYGYLKRQRIRFSWSFYLLTVSLLLFNGHFFSQSFMFRPEIMSMCLGFISFYFLQRSVSNGKLSGVALSGVFAGLATFTHLNGAIYSLAGFVALLVKKEYRKMLLFSAMATVFTLLYFFDIHSCEELRSWLHQFTTDPNVAGKRPIYIGLLKEQQRFFHSPREVTFTLLLIFSLVFGFKHVKENLRDLLLYLLTLVIGLGLLTHGPTAYYGLHYFPYIAIIVVAGYLHIFCRRSLRVRVLGALLLAGFVAVHGFYNVNLIRKRVNIAEHNATLSAHIPEKNVKIAAPLPFVFDEIGSYSAIRNEIGWAYHYNVFHPDQPLSLDSYLLFSAENGSKYVLLDELTTSYNLFQMARRQGLSVNDRIGGHELIYKSDTVFLFKNMEL